MSRRLTRFLPLLAAVAVPAVVLRVPAVRTALTSLIAYMRDAGLSGIAVFVGVEAFATVVLMPLWLMSGVAGYAYGFARGLLIALPAVIVCSCFAFLLSRASVARFLPMRAGESHFWEAVDRAVRTDGLKITLLLRLTFAIPQNLLNHALAATPMAFRHFALGSALGLVPATIFHVYVGSTVSTAAALLSGDATSAGPMARVALGVGFVMTVVTLFVTGRMARRALDRALRGAAPTAPSDPPAARA
jgi:uncharacterized membrane protein YdjX (TVP38/TMEM64 family)